MRSITLAVNYVGVEQTYVPSIYLHPFRVTRFTTFVALVLINHLKKLIRLSHITETEQIFLKADFHGAIFMLCKFPIIWTHSSSLCFILHTASLSRCTAKQFNVKGHFKINDQIVKGRLNYKRREY